MRLIISSSLHFYENLERFGKNLSNVGIETKIMKDEEDYGSFFFHKLIQTKKKRNNFQKLMKSYKPDFVFTDKPSHFSLVALECKIPLVIYLRGDYWKELKWADETIYKNLSLPKRIALKKWRNMVDECLKNSSAIITVSNFLQNVVKKKYPEKQVFVMYPSTESSFWFPQAGIKLKHPCVGLLQQATIWGKTKEMLILPEVMKLLPNVNFYWAGDGPYMSEILPQLQECKNFEWVGNLKHPEKVRQFFTEIDVYAMFSGFDSLGMTCVEAGYMKKPVVVSNVGGTPETILNKKSGFLIDKGNIFEWVKKLSLLTNNKELAKKMGEDGFKFVLKNFNSNTTNEFLKILQSIK